MEQKLKEVGQLFLKLGTIAFGGPAAHIAMMEEEVVSRRKWMDRQHFLDLIGATNLIPGPNSTEMTMHVGYERAGIRGLFLAGICFILPAVLITAVFAWLYADYGQLPQLQPYIYGIKPAVIAIIAAAAFKLGQKAVKNKVLGVLGVLTLLATLLGISEIIALFAAGLLGVLIYFSRDKLLLLPVLISPLGFLQNISSAPLISVSALKTFLIFLKVGAILYGSGYVLFAFLDAELVATGYMSRSQLIDAVAIGQFTPGPVLSTATFIGWQLAGWKGAVAATAGIFLPSFIFVLILNPLVPKLRQSKPVSAFLDAVNVAAVAVIFSVATEMALDTFTDWRTLVIALLSLIVVFRYKKMNSAWIVVGGAFAGWLLWWVQ